MKYIRILYILMVIPFIIGAKGRLVNGIVATVNGAPITLYQLKQRAQILTQKYPDKKNLDKLALDDLIDDDIIYSELKTIGITVSSRDVDDAIKQMSEANGISVAALKRSLNSKGISIDAYKDEIKGEIAKSKLVGYKFRTEITVTNDDIQIYYSRYKNEFSKVKQANISHILINVPPDASIQEQNRLLKKAYKVISVLKKGESFMDAAEKYSDDNVTKKNGGRLGDVEEGTLYPVLDKAIFNAKPGEIVGPLHTPIGYEIILINAFKSSGVLPLKAVRKKIRDNIYLNKLNSALKNWLLTKRQKAIITIYSELL